jgi:adenosylmethionine-8-amino-7-oxononanoate aminotransferase
MHPLAELDRRYLWHPFTQMRDWLKREPLVIVEGHGAVLRDARGCEYLDANSSIWTNLHGHNHPRLNAAVRSQLKKIAHSSALGLANEPAGLLAERLVKIANLDAGPEAAAGAGTARRRTTGLNKVFFSDDGSTAMEVALKLAYEFARRTGLSQRPKFLSLASAYHGDTVGAMALGHSNLFHERYRGLVFKTDKVMAPYCYRCRFNRARPERADAREYRECNWECLDQLEGKFKAQRRKGNAYAGFVVEPLIQGAAGMIAQPAGWLSQAVTLARNHGTLLLADEVMTGFGRTGTGSIDSACSCAALHKPANAGQAAKSAPSQRPQQFLLACHREGVCPDLLALAKGLTGGYLPMAATLTSQEIFEAFLGEYHEFKTFFHGHSFTANQLGAAAALASLDILRSPESIRERQVLDNTLAAELGRLWAHSYVGDIRQVGLCAGVELVKDSRTRKPFELRERVGIRVCEAMTRRGVLTRPIGNVIVLMPPYCTSKAQVQKMVCALDEAIAEVL